ncbi:unnamed protein product [Effrenium voratum]|nr:unnamed protein product [Effrenium voratum]
MLLQAVATILPFRLRCKALVRNVLVQSVPWGRLESLWRTWTTIWQDVLLFVALLGGANVVRESFGRALGRGLRRLRLRRLQIDKCVHPCYSRTSCLRVAAWQELPSILFAESCFSDRS